MDINSIGKPEHILKARIRTLRGMEMQDLFWTPLGVFSGRYIQFLVDKEIIQGTDDYRFFIWMNGGKKKWDKLKTGIFEKYFKVTPGLSKQFYYADNCDYIATAISNIAQISTKQYKTPQEHYEEVEAIQLKDGSEDAAKIFDKYYEICEKMLDTESQSM